MTFIEIMIDLLVFGLMVLNGGTNMVNLIEQMISLLVFGLMVLNGGYNMVNFIVMVTFLLGFGQMGEWNIGLMMRESNEYL
jgi:hypothetical protein